MDLRRIASFDVLWSMLVTPIGFEPTTSSFGNLRSSPDELRGRSGASGRNRTCDHQCRKLALCPTELRMRVCLTTVLVNHQFSTNQIPRVQVS